MPRRVRPCKPLLASATLYGGAAAVVSYEKD